MPTDSAALIIACISGAVSLGAAGYAESSRRRLLYLESELAQRREAATKADEAARLVAKYRDPLLRSAYDLQSRIYNVYRRGFSGRADPEYLRLNTLFVFAEFLGWLEIIRRDMQFLDLGAVAATKELGKKLEAVQHRLASTSEMRDSWYIYRGHQRAIGELMLTRVEADPALGRRHDCMGYAAFVEAQSRPEFARWFTRLSDAVERLPHEKPTRLVCVQRDLIDLIDLLDPACNRFESGRGKLEPRSAS
jgi:hypothetical protein